MVEFWPFLLSQGFPIQILSKGMFLSVRRTPAKSVARTILFETVSNMRSILSYVSWPYICASVHSLWYFFEHVRIQTVLSEEVQLWQVFLVDEGREDLHITGHHRSASEKPFKLRFAGVPMMIQHWMLAW